jgi:hypothetical protein
MPVFFRRGWGCFRRSHDRSFRPDARPCLVGSITLRGVIGQSVEPARFKSRVGHRGIRLGLELASIYRCNFSLVGPDMLIAKPRVMGSLC